MIKIDSPTHPMYIILQFLLFIFIDFHHSRMKMEISFIIFVTAKSNNNGAVSLTLSFMYLR